MTTAEIVQEIGTHLRAMYTKQDCFRLALLAALDGLARIEALADVDADQRSVMVRETYQAMKRALEGE